MSRKRLRVDRHTASAVIIAMIGLGINLQN